MLGETPEILHTMTTISSGSGQPAQIVAQYGSATTTMDKVALYDLTPDAQQFHTTEQAGYTPADIYPLAQKWAQFFPGGDQRMDPRRATTLLLVLEHSVRAFAQMDEAQQFGTASELAALIFRSLRSLGSFDLFQVQALRGPTGLVARQGAYYPFAVVPYALNGRYSATAMQDLQAFHGVDAAAEVLQAFALQAGLSLMRAQLEAVLSAAPEVLGAAHVPVETLLYHATASFRHQRLGSARSPKASYFAVMGPEQVKRLTSPIVAVMSSEQVKRLTTPLETAKTPEGGITKLGEINIGDGQIVTVYEDPFFPPTSILAGWRNGPDDAGAAWTPHTMVLKNIEDAPPEDVGQLWRQLVMRSAFRIFEPSFFAHIQIPPTKA